MIKTTQDLIKVLPFDKEFKKELLENYETLDPDKKFNIQVMLWDTYDGLFDLKLEKNLTIAYEEAKNNQEKLDSELYQRVRDLTEDEMNRLTEEDIKALDLDVARDKLKAILYDKNT